MSVTYTLQVDYDLDGDWTDVGDTLSGVVEMRWFLGMERAFGLVNAPGWAEIDLDNRGQGYSPEVTAGLLPGLPARIQSDDGVTVRTHFTGFVEEVRPTPGISWRKATVRLGDYARELEANIVRIPLALDVTADEALAAVLERCVLRYAILSGFMIIGVGGYDLLDTGKLFGDAVTLAAEVGSSTLPYVGDTWGDGIAAGQAIRQIVEAERGRFFWTRGGVPTFYNRQHTLIDSTVDASFSTGQMLEYRYAADVVTWVRLRYVPRSVGAAGSVLWTGADTYRINPGVTREIVVAFHDSLLHQIGATVVLELYPQTDYTVNGAADGSGVDYTDVVETTLRWADGSGAMIQATNGLTVPVWLRGLQVRGTPLNREDPVVLEVTANEGRTFYGVTRLDLELPLVSASEDALAIAAYELGRRRYPHGTLGEIRVSAVLDSVDVLALTLFDRVTISEAQTGHEADYFIISERHRVMLMAHEVTWGLELADSGLYFIIDTDVLDGTHVLSY